MTQVTSKAIHQTISVARIIAHIKGNCKGPIIVFFAGIHGNETAGVFALEAVLKSITPAMIQGEVYGISGNLKALNAHQRYLDSDLNRLWTKSQLQSLEHRTAHNHEEQEQVVLFKLLNQIIDQHTGPFYFIDFHTTSSKTLPFITINDALINRKFSKLFPVPIVLGIEEYLNGPLLSYINELGYVSLGFESGQHDDPMAIDNCRSFIYLALVYTEILKQDTSPHFENHFKKLQQNAHQIADIFEVVYLYQIGKKERFQMKPGFKSFQKITKGTELAVSDDKTIASSYNARLFMPLYQSQGEEGFFIIKPIQPFILKLSAVLRRLRFDGLLVLLPGISWANNSKDALKVNLKIARFFAKSLFHLLGYRNKTIGENYLLLYNRERASKVKAYRKENWY